MQTADQPPFRVYRIFGDVTRCELRELAGATLSCKELPTVQLQQSGRPIANLCALHGQLCLEVAPGDFWSLVDCTRRWRGVQQAQLEKQRRNRQPRNMRGVEVTPERYAPASQVVEDGRIRPAAPTVFVNVSLDEKRIDIRQRVRELERQKRKLEDEERLAVVEPPVMSMFEGARWAPQPGDEFRFTQLMQTQAVMKDALRSALALPQPGVDKKATAPAPRPPEPEFDPAHPLPRRINLED